MRKIAMALPIGLDRGGLHRRVKKFASKEEAKGAAYLSNMGRTLEIGDANQVPAHLFARLDPSFSALFVLKELAVAYANDFTAAWLGSALLDMGEGGALYLEIPNDRASRSRNQIDLEFLRTRLAAAKPERTGDWVRLSHSPGLVGDIQGLRTIYPQMHGRFEEFFRVFSEAPDKAGADPAKVRQEAVSTWIYSLFGANQKGFLVERILAELGPCGSIRGIDLGGGLGMLAAELAAKGCDMTLLDHKSRNTEIIGPWLARSCGLEPRMRHVCARIEDVGRIEGGYDLVSYFGCLLYLDRAGIPGVLRESMKLLKPGGLLLVHENPKEAGKPGSADFAERFEAEELKGLLEQNAGTPVFYNMFTANRAEWKTVRNRVIMAVVRKD